jgi:hypothetical protein
MMAQHLVEGVRLVLLAKEALLQTGVTEPERHLAVIQGGAVATLLMSRRAFDAADLTALDASCAKHGFIRHWPPGPGTPPGSPIPPLIRAGGQSFQERGLDVSSPTDDRPFFFQAVPITGAVDAALVEKLSVNEQSVVLLRQLVIVVCALAAALFFLPFAFGARLRGERLWQGSAYFVAIGLAFILIETAWVQRFILYLGHPSYATTVVLAAMLLGAGLGAITSARVSIDRALLWGAGVPLYLALVNAALGPAFQTTLGWAFPGRVALSVLLLLPSGFLMGFGFPLGMLRFGDESKAWFWAMNGAFSVAGSVSSLALAMLLGHAAVAYTGAAVYVAAFLLLRAGWRTGRSA